VGGRPDRRRHHLAPRPREGRRRRPRPLTDLLLLIYKRRPGHGAGIEVFGDADLLGFWLERVSFG
jgi:hypothetical protein